MGSTCTIGLTHKMKRLLCVLGMVIACLVLVAFVIVAVIGARVQATTVPGFLGNSSENVSRLTTTTDPDNFTFLVVGDVQHGTATFEHLLEVGCADKPAFAVILGDFVSDPQFARHKLFALEMAEDPLPLPVFLLPGNHDVSPDGPFRIQDFEQTYGPAQFHFTIGECLFLFLNNAPPYDKSGNYLAFMEAVLSEKAGQVGDIFVFMHVPPSGLSSWVQARPLYGSEKFMELAERFHVRYVFTGDHHGYVKTERDGTTYIVTGGGGASLRGMHGRFHHLVRIAVAHGSITETVIAAERGMEGPELLEQNIAVHLWPLITRSLGSVTVTLLLLAATVSLLILSLEHWKRFAVRFLGGAPHWQVSRHMQHEGRPSDDQTILGPARSPETT
jgi:hypothetical protein